MNFEFEVTDAGFETFRSGKAKKNLPHGRHKFGERPFMTWDGEGYTVWEVNSKGQADRVHKYCLFGNSMDEFITGIDISTEEVFSFLEQAKIRYPNHIHVSFAFEYDVNMMLGDLPHSKLKLLKKSGFVTNVFGKYRIEHRPKKWFQLSWKGENQQPIAIRVFDMFSFFSSSFMTALKKYVPEFADAAIIEKGKAQRANFSYVELDSKILPYWRMEQRGFIELTQKFRRTLYAAGINITSWHGPGAIADYLFKQHDSKAVFARPDNREIEYASRCAYAGGRFELFRAGNYEGDVYSYDINSAYPYAISQLPNLSTGRWIHESGKRAENRLRNGNEAFRIGLVRLEFLGTDNMMFAAMHNAMPMPLFHRSKVGNVAFPVLVGGWYHLDEVRNVLDFPETRIQEAWLYEDDGTYPFKWVAEIFEQRLIWKREGNPAEWAAKLGMNSLYGKLAQRIGWNEETGEPPKWHNLEAAGFITSTCRSMLWPLLVEAASKSSLLSIETDGIYTSQPLQVPREIYGIGTGLGQFEMSRYSGMTLLQSGMYWLQKDGQWLPPKSRGIPRERMDHDRAIRVLKAAEGDNPIVRGKHTTFIGYGAALHRGEMGEWRHWVDNPRQYVFGGDGKRFHNPKTCGSCRDGIGYHEGLHPLSLGRVEGLEPTPHALPWRDNDYAKDVTEERLFEIQL